MFATAVFRVAQALLGEAFAAVLVVLASVAFAWVIAVRSTR
jgi:hypothetical protein